MKVTLEMRDVSTKFIGVDYGAKLAGTTSVCWEADKMLFLRKSRKNSDADRFLLQIIQELSPERIFIDAPLSLPLAYSGKGDNFFFRDADRALQAMSPMFLGGLTARAVQLKYNNPEIEFFETYPRKLVKHLKLIETYKSNVPEFTKNLNSILPMPIKDQKLDWHMIDSVLAWFSGWRVRENMASYYGNREEGLIWI